MSLQCQKILPLKIALQSALYILFYILLLACFAKAQYRFDHWTEENGLPQNWIKSIWQTRDGYLWLTTGQGVARFDGVRFKIFNRANTPSLTSDRFSLYAIWEDRAGNLWMGTEDGGVIRYRDGVFTALTSDQGLPGDNVLRVDEDAEGVVWIVTSTGLARWKDGHLTRVAPAPDSQFNNFLVAPRNLGKDAKYFGLWRKNSGGWQRFAYGKWEPFPLPPHVKDPAQLEINSIVEDARGRVWYNLPDRLAESYLVEDERLTTIRHATAGQNVFYKDSNGQLWLKDQKGNSLLAENNRVTPLTDLPTNFFQVFEDREGTIWIATLSHGLYRLKQQIVTVYLHPGGAQYNNIQPLMQDRAGNVWVGSGGLARFVEGRFENFYHEGLSRSPVFERNVLIALFEDIDGSFWLGVRDGIVRLRDGRLVKDEELSAQIKGWVHVIHRDRAGNLWFGSEEGLYCLHDGKLTRYGTEDGLASPHIRVIHEDSAGTLWIGTVGGLTRRTQDGFRSLNAADGVAPARISALYEDAAGVLWVGTYDGVLYRLMTDSSGKTVITRYANEQNLPYDAIHKILEDDQGFFWIGGQRGIYRLRKKELEDIAVGQPTILTVIRLSKDDGLRIPSCNSWGQPAGFKASDGKLWFPTEEGVAVIDPKDLPFNRTPPPVLIEECLLDRQPVAIGSGLQISPDQENLEINYIALSFIKPEQMRFRYKLEGLDREWVEAGSRRTAYYSHLPPGEYVFKVIAANSDGVWNETGQSLAIMVLPPFYRTGWFFALCVLAICGLAFVVYKKRIKRVEEARRAQEDFSRRLINAHEEERRRVAAELHDSIGQTLAMIKNRAVFASQTTENLAAHEQFDAITAQTTQAIGEVREISYNLRPYLLDNLGLTKAIKSLVNKIEEVHLLTISAQICDVDDLFVPEAEMSVYRIVQESLNNVVKHAEADAAALTIERTNGIITIKIEDDGQGFDKNAPPKTEAEKGGFGLLGITERVRMLGGSLDIQTAIGSGTKLTIKIAANNKIIKEKNG